MKIIFLDIDGVLNFHNQGNDNFGALFHKPFEDNLRTIIEATDAKIVISSTWRMSGLEVMKDLWKARGLAGEVIDITPECGELIADDNGDLQFYDQIDRGHEIEFWLMENPSIKSYVILDDEIDMLPHQRDNFVRCSNNRGHSDSLEQGKGLTKGCAEMAILTLLRKIQE